MKKDEIWKLPRHKRNISKHTSQATITACSCCCRCCCVLFVVYVMWNMHRRRNWLYLCDDIIMTTKYVWQKYCDCINITASTPAQDNSISCKWDTLYDWTCLTLNQKCQLCVCVGSFWAQLVESIGDQKWFIYLTDTLTVCGGSHCGSNGSSV